MPFISRKEYEDIFRLLNDFERDYRKAAELVQSLYQEKMALMKNVPTEQARALEDMATILENESDNGMADGVMHAVGKMRQFADELRRGAEGLNHE